MHLVHKHADSKGKYGVLGFIFEITKKSSTLMDALTRELIKIHEDGDACQREDIKMEFDLMKLISKSLKSGFFAYHGSLTTPPCTETVYHKVFVKPIGITYNTLRYFQNLKNSKDDPLGGNHRPIQPLNEREVTFSRSVKINGEWESWDYANHWDGEKSNGKFWLINV